MRMRKTTALRWIEEADARKVCEMALAQRRTERREAASTVGRRLSAFGATLRATLFARAPKRRDCRC